jgi:hypothetical protein
VFVAGQHVRTTHAWKVRKLYYKPSQVGKCQQQKVFDEAGACGALAIALTSAVLLILHATEKDLNHKVVSAWL